MIANGSLRELATGEASYFLKMISFVISVVFIITAYIYVRCRQRKEYWAKRQVPYLPPHPVFGSLEFLQRRENPGPFYRRMYEDFKVPYMGIWVFWRPAVLVNSVKIARNILVKDQANFRNRFASSGTTDPVGALNLFTLDDPLWTLIRKRLTVIFTSSKLRGMQKIVTQKTKNLIQRIEKERQKPYHMNLREILTDYSTDIVGTSVFGVESDATLSGESVIRSVTNDYVKYDLFRAVSWVSIFFIPELVDIFRFKLFPTWSTEYLRKIMQKMIGLRGGLENKVTEPKDLLDVLIMLKQEGGEELKMTEDMMLAQAAIFLQGGFETSALTLSFGIYELAFCPDVQDKLHKELKHARDIHGDNLLNASILSQLTYLNCVLNECFRKYLPLPVLDRVALKDYQLDDHLTITAGTPVFLNVLGIQHDPDMFPDSDKFNPDRFLPENKGDQRLVLMPFGEGPRMCIGQRFGLSIVRHGLAAIVLDYDIRPLPKAKKPSEINLDSSTLFIAPGDNLSVEFIPRN